MILYAKLYIIITKHLLEGGVCILSDRCVGVCEEDFGSYYLVESESENRPFTEIDKDEVNACINRIKACAIICENLRSEYEKLTGGDFIES